MVSAKDKRHDPISFVIKTTKGKKMGRGSERKKQRLSRRNDTKELNLYRVESTVEFSLSYCILDYNLNESRKTR